MTPSGEPVLPEVVRSAIRSRHPSLSEDIQGAINTLRKLQQIAGSPGSEALPLRPVESPRDTADIAPASLAGEALGATAFSGGGDGGAAPQLTAGDSFGRYQIVRILGRGGMGTVYLGYDGELQRHVALKTPLLGANLEAIERFVREARAVARLQSPSICPVYDVGQIGGIHYLSMAFIDGQSLARVIAEGRLRDQRAIAESTYKIARGLQKAHEQGVIHRDLKPENIMIDRDGEPVVMDFGLARRLDDEEVRLTAPGRLLGTPAYMSPEQLDGDPAKMGPGSDIYSLGAVLYEMLTGQAPFRGPLSRILRQIISEAPPPPSSVNTALGPACPLDRICLTMLAKSPADRYPSMARVAEAIDEVFPSQRLPVPPPARWQQWFSRARGWFASRPQPRPAAAAPASAPLMTLADSNAANPPPPAERVLDRTIDLAPSR